MCECKYVCRYLLFGNGGVDEGPCFWEQLLKSLEPVAVALEAVLKPETELQRKTLCSSSENAAITCLPLGPCMTWLLGPNSITVPCLDPLGRVAPFEP